jgi:NAD(P)H-dependent flavin oxidoreductase YrpB (nitropropane dioxygenase family)
MLRSAWTDAWEESSAPSTLPMPDQTMLTAAAQQRINRHAGDAGSGAQELATYFVGQIVGSMTAVRPARQVMLDLVTDYADAAERFVGYLGD